MADWLRWRWRRHQKDRPDAGRWAKAVREELPRQRAVADEAVAWLDLGVSDRRTKAARAAKVAMRAGGIDRARAVVSALRAASSAAADVNLDRAGAKPAGPLTDLSVRPWKARPAVEGWKRRKADRMKAPRLASGPPKPIGRPRRTPDSPGELAALAAVLRAAGPEVHAMYQAIPRQEDQVWFLRDLRAYANAPDNAGALRRWMRWVQALR